ncbi:hypothetical protein [Pseudoalteromonas phage PH357]|nr:hypothetical protein [Pseudoalteromonas phage PH357]
MNKQHEQELTSLAIQSYFKEGVFEDNTIPKETILKAIQRMEDYPCCMSCHLTLEGLNAAKSMRDTMIRILKEEIGL